MGKQIHFLKNLKIYLSIIQIIYKKLFFFYKTRLLEFIQIIKQKQAKILFFYIIYLKY